MHPEHSLTQGRKCLCRALLHAELSKWEAGSARFRFFTHLPLTIMYISVNPSFQKKSYILLSTSDAPDFDQLIHELAQFFVGKGVGEIYREMTNESFAIIHVYRECLDSVKHNELLELDENARAIVNSILGYVRNFHAGSFYFHLQTD